MENTTENKLRFFAQYFGQMVLVNSIYNELSKIDFTFFYKSYNRSNNNKYYHLELRHINSITNDECILLFELSEKRYSSDSHYKITFIKSLLFNGCFNIFHADWLRSKAFLVPFMNLTTDQIIEFGWAKIKD